MTPPHRPITLLVALALTTLAPVGAARARHADPTVAQLLAAAGAYVADYERSFGAIVAEEMYTQATNYLAAGEGPKRRVTKAAVLTFNSGGSGWMVFRDVLEVDAAPIAGPPDRLLKVATDPTREALADAMRATADSARYNIGSLPRMITIPTTALTFLRVENQPQSTFEFDGMKTLGKLDVAVLKFKATNDAPAIDDTTTSGRFWIEPASGRVVRTELASTSRLCDAKVEVQYASQPGIAVWVPVRMFEQYDVVIPPRNIGRVSSATSAHVDGLATYQNFRAFEAKAGLLIK